MAHFIKDEGSNKDALFLRYQGIDIENLDGAIEELFLKRGYKLYLNKPGDKTYEKGDHTTRILLGAFVKYFKFRVMTTTHDDGAISVKVIRATSGYSGGVIGRNQVTQEMINVSDQLKAI